MRRLKELFSLKGKSAVVTGGAGILGKWFCSGLAEFGANVAVVDIDGRAAAALAKDVREKFKVKSVGIACDVSDEGSVKKMLRAALGAFGRVDILHNNACSKSLITHLVQLYFSFKGPENKGSIYPHQRSADCCN